MSVRVKKLYDFGRYLRFFADFQLVVLSNVFQIEMASVSGDHFDYVRWIMSRLSNLQTAGHFCDVRLLCANGVVQGLF